MLTRASVVWADRIVAASSSNGLRWSSSQTASGIRLGEPPGDLAGPPLRRARADRPARRRLGVRGRPWQRRAYGRSPRRYRRCRCTTAISTVTTADAIADLGARPPAARRRRAPPTAAARCPTTCASSSPTAAARASPPSPSRDGDRLAGYAQLATINGIRNIELVVAPGPRAATRRSAAACCRGARRRRRTTAAARCSGGRSTPTRGRRRRWPRRPG